VKCKRTSQQKSRMVERIYTDSFRGCISKQANHGRNTINVNVKKYFVGNLLQGIMLSLSPHQIAAQ
jgi:hypothetical protein